MGRISSRGVRYRSPFGAKNDGYDEANGAEAGGLRGVGTFSRTRQNLCSFSHFCWQVRTKTTPKTSVKTLSKLSSKMEQAILNVVSYPSRYLCIDHWLLQNSAFQHSRGRLLYIHPDVGWLVVVVTFCDH